jgi:hypothetical protein
MTKWQKHVIKGFEIVYSNAWGKCNGVGSDCDIMVSCFGTMAIPSELWEEISSWQFWRASQFVEKRISNGEITKEEGKKNDHIVPNWKELIKEEFYKEFIRKSLNGDFKIIKSKYNIEWKIKPGDSDEVINNKKKILIFYNKIKDWGNNIKITIADNLDNTLMNWDSVNNVTVCFNKFLSNIEVNIDLPSMEVRRVMVKRLNGIVRIFQILNKLKGIFLVIKLTLYGRDTRLVRQLTELPNRYIYEKLMWVTKKNKIWVNDITSIMAKIKNNKDIINELLLDKIGEIYIRYEDFTGINFLSEYDVGLKGHPNYFNVLKIMYIGLIHYGTLENFKKRNGIYT